MELSRFFQEYPRAAVAFSGGADSAYLLYAARQSGAHVKAYYVKTPFQPAFEHADACRLANELGIDLETISLDILEDDAIAANPKDRCYHCKKRIFSAIASAARADGFSVILDGTNASDDASDRPGMRALQELSVLSPLRLCGLTKSRIRQLSKEAGLFTWNKPAYACLATRVPTGTAITADILARTEQAEAYLHTLGFSDFRIRLMGDAARLQLTKTDIPTLLANREAVVTELKKYYSAVVLDLEVRHG